MAAALRALMAASFLLGGCSGSSSDGPVQPGGGGAVRLAFTVQPSNAVAGAAIAPAVQVAIEDAQGKTVTTAGNAITLAIGTNPANGTLSGTTTVAAVNGVASFSTLGMDKTGTGYTLTASATGLTGAASSAFNVSVGPAAKLAFTVQPSNAVAGAAIAPAVQVAVQDAQGNTATTATKSITVTIGTNPVSGTLSGTTTVSAVNGVSTFPTLGVDKAAAGYTLSASATGLTSATSSAFNIAAGGATKLAFSAQPTNAIAGSTITPAVQVAIQDAQGNTVATATNTITVAIGTNPASGALSGTSTLAAVNGIATFTTLSITNAGIGYTLTASATNLTAAVSGSFNVTTPAIAPGVRLSTGFGHTCGLTVNRALYCWGDNAYGEFGNGTTTGSPAPVASAGGLAFASVSAGGFFTCGLTSAGAAYCWGLNEQGRLGNGSTTGPQTCLGNPVANYPCSLAPVAVLGGLTFTAVSAGTFSSCGLTASGVAYCWGDNVFGELGTTGSTSSAVPVQVLGGRSFSTVSAGSFFACGVTTAGRAYCWGKNVAGELGNGTTVGSATPVAVVGGLSFASVSTGNEYACGVTIARAAYCWGWNNSGQLGNGNLAITYSATPVPVSGGLSFATLSVGSGQTCGVTTGGAAYCWGSNDAGELGNGTQIKSAVPIAVSGGHSFATVSAGAAAVCGVTTTGAAYCWGNGYGLTPVAIPGGLSF